MKSLFDTSSYEEVLNRLDSLSEESAPKWGKMDVAQMVSHCQNPLAVALGKKSLKKPNFIMRLLYKSFKAAMYNDKPWKNNLATPAEYRVDSPKVYQAEKSKLKALLLEFYEKRGASEWEPHPSFGEFTHDQWGQMQYKHIDHHLRQFGV